MQASLAFSFHGWILFLRHLHSVTYYIACDVISSEAQSPALGVFLFMLLFFLPGPFMPQ